MEIQFDYFFNAKAFLKSHRGGGLQITFPQTSVNLKEENPLFIIRTIAIRRFFTQFYYIYIFENILLSEFDVGTDVVFRKNPHVEYKMGARRGEDPLILMQYWHNKIAQPSFSHSFKLHNWSRAAVEKKINDEMKTCLSVVSVVVSVALRQRVLWVNRLGRCFAPGRVDVMCELIRTYLELPGATWSPRGRGYAPSSLKGATLITAALRHCHREFMWPYT